MGTRKQINLRISGSRVLGRLKKSLNAVEIQIYTPSIYCPLHIRAKKLANSREKKKHQTNSKNSFSSSLCFLLLHFSYSIFSLSSIFTSNLKRKETSKKKKKSIKNQEDGTSFPPHKILKHLKDLKILSDPKICNIFLDSLVR